jgi:hypothetical protein
MAETIATVSDLQARLDWTLEAGEQGVAQGALDDLSDDARYYGSQSWDSETAPRQVRSLVLRAAARYMRNPDGYVQSRAGDETLVWTDKGDHNGLATFTAEEKKILSSLAGKNDSGLYSVEISAWRTKPQPQGPGYVQVVPGSYGAAEPRPFPFFESEGTFW